MNKESQFLKKMNNPGLYNIIYNEKSESDFYRNLIENLNGEKEKGIIISVNLSYQDVLNKLQGRKSALKNFYFLVSDANKLCNFKAEHCTLLEGKGDLVELSNKINEINKVWRANFILFICPEYLLAFNHPLTVKKFFRYFSSHLKLHGLIGLNCFCDSDGTSTILPLLANFCEGTFYSLYKGEEIR